MKNQTSLLVAVIAAIWLQAEVQAQAQPVVPASALPGELPKTVQNQVTLDTSLSSEIKPMPVLTAMQRVADWQLGHPSAHKTTDWTQGAGYAGMMALAGISSDTKYRDAMLAMGETNQWSPGPRKFHADDYCVGQTYTELYLLYRQPKMIAPLKERFDDILSNPTTITDLNFKQPKGVATENWSWCDALFMGPPTWVRLYAATHDDRYLTFAVTNWWRTTDFLYDKDEHLFFRDSTFIGKTEANGKKVFWGRGNGWVMGGLVRVLQYLPANHPDRSRFEQLFKDMADKILTCQQPDGLWRASLLDPDSYPLKETSGSGFFTYALAWGVNQGLLNRPKFEPAVQKAWAALVGCVDADGKLTHVQPVGADPKKFPEDATEVYGTGAFLLAGSEIYRMAVFESAMATPVTISNPADFARESETVELNLSGKPAVMDSLSSRIIDSQSYQLPEGGDKFVFQVDLDPGETRTFYVLDASALAAVPQPIVKTMARFVPERYDDFAWESDRIAHRTYGLALIKAENTISSGPDVWIKKDHRLIVDVMYATKHYHEDNGEFMD
ncbi:MAG TPA: glycoside hydrolase family 88 protein, partial [Verrucomicrobiae bacterium]|nr:glycoside hydrolase family 88 protein [Verrucomicrobiae bacterium]